ncbi:MAG: uroporphyrinogen-III synthase [Acidobacteriota bacterium]|nr:uroporphyrinogen-III synthase [Acidobacteriota bacterium]
MAPLPWRVAVTRDEDERGALSSALVAEGFVPVRCTVMEESPPANPAVLAAVASGLDAFDWIICSSVRAVSALAGARTAAWPRGVRTAAVGPSTAAALVSVGADPPPLTGESEGADALWIELAKMEWSGRRVLVPTVPGGRRVLAQSLRSAGAAVTEVEAYRMVPRTADRIRADWNAARPDAAVFGSPSAVNLLVGALGADALIALAARVVIGPTTAAALAAAGVPGDLAARADFREAARTLAKRRDAASPRAW